MPKIAKCIDNSGEHYVADTMRMSGCNKVCACVFIDYEEYYYYGHQNKFYF